jgi:hypothetical protein
MNTMYKKHEGASILGAYYVAENVMSDACACTVTERQHVMARAQVDNPEEFLKRAARQLESEEDAKKS